MPEKPQTITPEAPQNNSEASETRRQAVAPLLGGEALLATSIQSFYGASDAYLGRSVGGSEVRSIIKNKDGKNEVISSGQSLGDTLSATLEAMHSLELVDTPPITRFSVDGKNVSFTELKHYAPRIAPSSEAYLIPTHLERVLKNDSMGMETYDQTTKHEGWQKQLFEQVSDYADQDESINELVRNLNITSLSTLTPEQAVKLSLGIVQLSSKYSWVQEGEKRVAGGKREDTMTTMELLAEGRAHVGETEWDGNGVCRNVASNVKAVFESLKANQTDLSMLNNTYAVYEGGSEGFGTRKRGDTNKFSIDGSGHAWNTFVTIGKNGESSITTVDATWAMGTNKEGSLKEPDFTSERMFENIAKISESTSDKTDVALAMSDYLNKFTRIIPGEGAVAREQKMQFALTEWLKVAPILVEADIPSVPNGVVGAAYRLGAQLDKSELQTLFTVHEAGWIDTFDAILGKYVDGKSVIGGSSRLISRDDGLQRAIYEKIGSRTEEYANQDTDFRIRLRDLQPGVLPDFDPANNVADKSELSSLMRDAGLFSIGNKYYGDVVRAGLLKAVDGRQDVVDSLTAGMSDYDVLRHYRDIRLVATKS
jgi:hypothetical protein